jgi:hypothetical protein
MIDLGLHVPCHSCFKINHVHRGLRTSHFDQAFISFVATAILRRRSPLPGFIAELRLQGVMKKDSSVSTQVVTSPLAFYVWLLGLPALHSFSRPEATLGPVRRFLGTSATRTLRNCQ